MESILLILAVLLTLIGLGYCLFKPKYAFVAVMLMFPAEQLLQSYIPALRMQYNWLANVLVGLVAVFAVGVSFVNRGDAARGLVNGVTLALGALFMYALVATVWTPAPESASYFIKANYPYWVLMLALCPLLLRNIQDFAHTMLPTMIGGIVISVMLFASPRGHFVSGRFTIDLGYAVGWGEVESNPLALADLGGSMIIMALLYRGSTRSTLVNLIRAAALAAGMALAVASGSRAQVVFSLLCGISFLPLLKERRNWSNFLGLGILGLFLLFLLVLFYKLLLDTEGSARWGEAAIGEGFTVRAEFALRMVGVYLNDVKAWIFGLGTSAFNFYYHSRAQKHWYPHNIFVEALTEYGIIGFGLLMVGCISCFRWSKTLFTFARDDIYLRSATLALLATTVFQMMLSTKQGHLIGPPMILTFMLLIAKLGKAAVWDNAQEAAAWIGEPADEQWGEGGAPEEGYDSAYEPQPY